MEGKSKNIPAFYIIMKELAEVGNKDTSLPACQLASPHLMDLSSSNYWQW